MRTAPVGLIFGILGQDGAYLADQLLAKGYEVHGTSRDAANGRGENLRALGIYDRVTLHSVQPGDLPSTLALLDAVRPTHVFNLAGQTSVGHSFHEPIETYHSVINGTLAILDGIRLHGRDVKFYNAASSEVFGEVAGEGATEQHPLHPQSPYGVAKSAALLSVANYRTSFELFACSGILFNHESPLRPERFVTQKVVRGAVEIAQRGGGLLQLGNLDIARDWGYAPEYVDAMIRILEQDEPGDFVIATGRCSTLKEFVACAFDCVGLDWTEHVEVAPHLMRRADIGRSVGCAAKAEKQLGWKAATLMPQLVETLVEAEMRRRASCP